MEHTDIDPALGLMAEFGKVTKGTVRHINQMRQDAIFADGAVPARLKHGSQRAETAQSVAASAL